MSFLSILGLKTRRHITLAKRSDREYISSKEDFVPSNRREGLMRDFSGSVKWVGYSFPTPEHPFWHIRMALSLDSSKRWKVERLTTDGRWNRDFYVYNDGLLARRLEDDPFSVGEVMDGGAHTEVVMWVDWTPGSEHRVEFKLVSEDGEEGTLVHRSRAPEWGGRWDPAWRYYAGVVLRENAGLERRREPVHLTLGLYADRVSDPKRELRVVAVEPDSGRLSEVPSQVYEVSSWEERKDERYQPTVTCDLAFLADVPARSSRVYLVFYGNPDAPEPVYPTDLVLEGDDLEITVDNSFYRMHTQPSSGCIDEVWIKMGVNRKYEHRLETNGAVQWNPGVYAPPRPWIHASDWNPPEGYSLISGPVFVATKRWGNLPLYPEVFVSITYIFYRENPYMLFSSVLEVKEDIDVQALRNGEIVFNREIMREFAWKGPDGSIGEVVITEGPRHPKHALRMEPDTPWVAFYNSELGCGFGGITLNLAEFRRDGGLVRKEYPFMYLAWGPWTYWSRVYTYSYGSNNPQRMIRVPGGSVYYERMAFLPFRLGREGCPEERFAYIDELQKRLADPLDVRVVMDTDERVPKVPEDWVPPILVEEFEEIEE